MPVGASARATAAQIRRRWRRSRRPGLPGRACLPRGSVRLPRGSVRLRLTLLYGGLFLLAGAVLLTITYVLVANQVSGGTATYKTSGGRLQITVGTAGPVSIPDLPAGAERLTAGATRLTRAPLPGPSPQRVDALRSTFQKVINGERSSELRSLLIWSGIALGIMALVSAALGWLIAGRVLAPLRTMTARARRISEDNLHERLALDGPADELKELGDTFDAVLGRLEGAFDAQRRFVANASHELRTPLTLERAMVEVALADPDADVESLRTTCRRVLATGEQQERLIEGLLTLARSQRGLEEREALDLRDISLHVLSAFEVDDGLSIQSELTAAAISGDERLVERLVANLVDNATRHNLPGGWVRVWTGVRAGRPTLTVSNSGPVMAPTEVDALLEPFRRAGAERTRHRDGHGLGLSIVAAIASAHGASLGAQARGEGGLDVEVSFGART
ncbi:MAG TPA: ATP-binding protein [Solirubrobacteraceae bacterium]|nr:ATP-binding protein [Solirubrobacteraceae bacterium]